MARKPRRGVSAVQQQAPESPVPLWVREMHEYFRRTGFYRPEDLQRVLGDPRESVQVRVETGLMPAVAGHTPNK